MDIVMAESLQRVGEQPSEFSVEDRNLRSVACESTVGSRRAAWRIIAGVEQKEKVKDLEQQTSHTREYVTKVEYEIQKIHEGIDENLTHSKVVECCHGCRPFGGSSSERLSSDSAAEQDLACDQEEHVKKCLEMLPEITELKDDCEKFYEQFGKCLPLEIQEAELLRFNTSEPGDERISFQLIMDTKFL